MVATEPEALSITEKVFAPVLRKVIVSPLLALRASGSLNVSEPAVAFTSMMAEVDGDPPSCGHTRVVLAESVMLLRLWSEGRTALPPKTLV